MAQGQEQNPSSHWGGTEPTDARGGWCKVLEISWVPRVLTEDVAVSTSKGSGTALRQLPEIESEAGDPLQELQIG